SPTGVALRTFTLRTLVSHWFHTPRPENVAQPEVEFGKGDANWWRLPLHDSALVSSADGSGKNIYARDRAFFRKAIVETTVLHWHLKRRWPLLAKQYKAHLESMTAPESWDRVFSEGDQ
ncbi:MAG: glycosyl transferase, partial [Henriciella sp.]|nr:glycosyl transferase [Henriciella sp.]